MKTVIEAIMSKVHWPLSYEFVETTCIERNLNGDGPFDPEVAQTSEYKGALADCLYSLIQAINFSEADKSVGTLTDKQREAILKWANKLYVEIGEEEKDDLSPRVYINC